MIQANELRIGNWVTELIKNRIVSIDGIEPNQDFVWVNYLNGYGQYKVEINDIYPIPLTPEILEKCGFEIYTENTGSPINEDIEYYSNQIDVFFDIHGCLIIKDYHYNINRPKYLHQLQNLYFILTGQELVFVP